MHLKRKLKSGNCPTNEIVNKYFVPRQTVNNIVKKCGFSPDDRKRITSDTIIAILNAQKLGLSTEEIVTKYAVKKVNE